MSNSSKYKSTNTGIVSIRPRIKKCTRRPVKKQTIQAKTIYAIRNGQFYGYRATKNDSPVQVKKSLLLRDSGFEGLGVYARRYIPKGEVITT